MTQVLYFPRATLGFFLLFMYAEAGAVTYRWVDADGKVHYSDALPSKAAGLGHQELDKAGRVIRSLPRTSFSPDERRLRMEEMAAQTERKREDAARERHDRALLSTYANVGELDLACDRAMSLEKATLDSLRSRLDANTKKLTQAQTQLQHQRAAGQPESAGTVQMRDEAQREVKQLGDTLRNREKVLADLEQRFSIDRARLVQLRGAQ